MKKNIVNKAFARVILLLLTVSVLLSALTSCDLLTLFDYVADNKDEIQNNIDKTPDDNKSKYVCDYLRDY